MKEREKFGSRLGFILVSAGCAVLITKIKSKDKETKKKDKKNYKIKKKMSKKSKK